MKLVATENGPIIMEVDETKVALCRCGKSQAKPFCDASHMRNGFRAKEAPIWPELTNTEKQSDQV